ncbi:hypothetical protein CEXT_515591 [Caerostris extrusa]|uniref:Uncharacterized protein n=1 Tax=Caerostris extrusa TaxID=172846 RepID=A0AAV4VIQ7_CAEEX|nr:hypothetical protein CEXT_515591 [Caerostris extrusa]
MSFLAKGRKKDLVTLAAELGEKIDGDLRILDFRELIMKTIFTAVVEFVQIALDNIIAERLEKEYREKAEEQNLANAAEKIPRI